MSEPTEPEANPDPPGCEECEGTLYTMDGPDPPNPCPCTFRVPMDAPYIFDP